MAKKKPVKQATNATATKPAQSKVIKLCVLYAQAIGGWNAAYEVDGSDGEYAMKYTDVNMKVANKIIAQLAVLPATTPEELISKARLVPFVAVRHAMVSGADADFIRSLALDVCKFVEQPEPTPAVA